MPIHRYRVSPYVALAWLAALVVIAVRLGRIRPASDGPDFPWFSGP